MQLTDAQVLKLVHDEWKRNGGGDGWKVGELKMTAIALAESGGNTAALNTNSDGTKDRGLFQFNNKWNPDISDADAFDPVKATQWAYKKSSGFTVFGKDGPQPGPLWTGSRGYVASGANPFANPFFKRAADATGIELSDGSLIDAGTTAATDAAGAVVDAIAPWADGLAKFLSYLTSASFWIRVGIGALGVVLVVFSVSQLSKSTIVGKVLPI